MKKNFKLYLAILISIIVSILNLQASFNEHFIVGNLRIGSQVFIENKGQWPHEVKYMAKLNGLNCWITSSGIVYDFNKIEKSHIKLDDNKYQYMNPMTKFEDTSNLKIKGQVIKMEFEDLKNSRIYIPQEKQKAYYNYFIGNEHSKWTSNVHLYKVVIVKDVYQNIDCRYYFDGSHLRYDMIVNPGADISQIKMLFNGQDGLRVNNKGEISLQTCLGEIRQNNIYAYQEVNGNKHEIKCKFRIDVDGKIFFVAKKYNKKLPLIIDPLVWSTFVGGTDHDYPRSICLDSFNNVIIGGYTNSADYPTVIGSYNKSINGNKDIFISKLNSEGTDLIFSTFIGGKNDEWFASMKMDKYQNIYFTGHTYSDNYPTLNAYNDFYNGGGDVFITKLNSIGTGLIFSTFFGSKALEKSRGLALDKDLNIYIAGVTNSLSFPTTDSALLRSNNAYFTGFISKFNPDASQLIYSTYFGGNNHDYINDIAVDNEQNIYIVGETNSNNFPTSSNAYQKYLFGKNNHLDAFVSKINSSGTNYIFSTYIEAEQHH